MSFLVDPPLLYAAGQAYGRLAPDAARAREAAGAVLAVFWGTSVALYLECAWTERMWRLLGARSGRDWMINSGVTRLDATAAGPMTHLLAAAIFATYPAWLAAGYRHGRRGRRRP